MNFNSESIEKIIEISFNDKKLLKQCFTHSSYANEHKALASNERLEFLGDAVLGLVVTEYLYKTFPDKNEGVLTKLKQKAVSKQPLSLAVERLGLEQFLLLGEGAKQSEAVNKNLHENLFEAIVAGLFIDGGIKKATEFITNKLLSNIDFNNSTLSNSDSKSKLIVLSQKRKLGEVHFKQIDKKGVDHCPIFTIAIEINGTEIVRAKGCSKQKAEQEASRLALNILTARGNNIEF